MEAKRIDHVGVAVDDAAGAIERYGVLGFRIEHEEINSEQGVREVMMSLPGDLGGTRLQILAPLDESSPIARFLAKRGAGVQQLALEVDDVDVAAAELRKAGWELLYESPRRGTAGSKINFVHPRDGGGVLIELVERGGSAAGERGHLE